MAKDFHNKPFDEATIVKLALFEEYIKEWLPVFFDRGEIIWRNINILDLFSGPGSDLNGVQGSPLLILEHLKKKIPQIESRKLEVSTYFNEYDKNKHKALEKNLANYTGNPFKITHTCEDFTALFPKYLPVIKNTNSANLVFLDQCGISLITPEVFKTLIECRTTDFLFFISSDILKRFTKHENVVKYFNLDPEDIGSTPMHSIHRKVTNIFKSLIPPHKQYYLGSFTLKKANGNIYGIIFGSNHVLGMEKFLKTCWKIDPERGEANFDIDSDNIIPGQIDMFTNQVKRPKKVELFEEELEKNILNLTLRTDRDLYLFALNNGFLPRHIKDVLKSLENEKKILKGKREIESSICKKGNNPNPIILT